MTIDDDDQLLNRLGEIFATDLGHRPSADELTAFRATLLASAGQHDDRPLDAECAPPADAQTETDGVVVPFVRPRRRLARRLAVTGAAAAITLSGLTAVAAAANNGVLPTPARVVAHAVGLPVDSVELARAKDDLRRLRGADDKQLPEAVERTEKALRALSEDERGHVGDEAERDLADAQERLGKRGPGNGPGNGSGGSGGGNSGPGGSGKSGDGAETTPTSAGGVGGPATTADDTGRQSGGGNSGGDDPASGGGTSVTTTSVATGGSDGSGGGGSGSGGDAGSGSGGDTGSGSGGDTGSGSDPPTTSSSGSGGSGSGSGSGSGTTLTTQSPSGKPVQSPSTTSSSSDTTAGGKGGGGGSKP